jgi:tetratricopeptide (TPR) repeat protein
MRSSRFFYTTLFVAALFCGFSTHAAFAQTDFTDREKGIELYTSGKYQEAIETLQKAVETDKEDKQAWLYLGASFARQKDDKQADKALNKADEILFKMEPAKKEPAKKDNSTPMKITRHPKAAYPSEAARKRVTGIVKLVVEFGADGKISFVYAFKTLPGGLTEQSIKAARQIGFEPAKKDGKPVSKVKIIEFGFEFK